MNARSIILNEQRNVTLSAYIQPVEGEFMNIRNRPAVLVLPGGGYTMCSDREAEPVIYPFLANGYHAFILRYSIKKNALWPNPLNDYEQAMEYIRSHADEWNLIPDKIAVIGFSAGGHLAGCAATIAKNKPNAAILGYAAVEGETITSFHPTAPDVISLVDVDTCPCFVFASRTDNMVPIRNSVKFINALTEHDISFESHIYAYGPHGFSTCNMSVLTPGTELCSRIPQWINDCMAWLEDMFGRFDAAGFTKPKCRGHINGNHEAFLNADCTMSFLSQNPQANAIMGPITEQSAEAYAEYFAEEKDPDEPHMDAAILYDTMSLRDILSYGGVPQETIEQIDAALQQIPNC